MPWDKIAISKYVKIIKVCVIRYSFHLENTCLLKECQVRIRCERFTDLMCVSGFLKLRKGVQGRVTWGLQNFKE